MTAEQIERFWDKVTTGKPDECWLWRGALAYFGYGKLGVNHRTLGAHRVSYELAYGEIPEGKQVLHKCDVPACVNPAHLFLGTQLDNVQDCIQKRRHHPGFGARHARARFTESEIIQIRIKAATVAHRQIAIQMGVSPNCIDSIVNRRTWKHVA